MNLNDWHNFRIVVDYLIDKNIPIPKDLNRLDSHVFLEAVKYIEKVDQEFENYLYESKKVA
jgi:hypothetical protein